MHLYAGMGVGMYLQNVTHQCEGRSITNGAQTGARLEGNDLTVSSFRSAFRQVPPQLQTV
jgi:hypothetical protein